MAISLAKSEKSKFSDLKPGEKMKNTVMIDVHGQCTCNCVSNVYDYISENIRITFAADSYDSPQIEVEFEVGGDIETHDLEIENGLAVYDFPLTNFDKSPFINFRYLDGEKVGTWFTLRCTQGGTVPNNHTLRVFKSGDTNFIANYVVIYDFSSAMTYNDEDFIIKELSATTSAAVKSEPVSVKNELSIKDVKSIIVQATAAGVPTDIGFIYEDNTGKNYEVAFNADGKLAKFGDITIDWQVNTE